MALVLADRVLETSTSEGLGTFALAGAQTGYQTFSNGIGNGNTCYYTINGQTTEQWEVGIGTVGAGTLARTTLISSNTGSFINFVAGVKNVFVTQPASKSIYKDANGDAIPLGSASATQLDITAQGDLRLQDTTGGEYVAIQAPTTLAASYTLTMPVDDGTSGQALVTDGLGVLSWSSAASGDVYGPASATDNAIARYDGTTGKIIQNSAVTIGDDGATVIDANSTSAGLRITQVGTGNALLVEDDTNPDSSPFVVDNAGRVLAGQTLSYLFNDFLGVSRRSQFQFSGTSTLASMFTVANWSTLSASPSSLNLAKSKSGTVGTQAVVSNGDDIGVLEFSADDGTTFIPAASILAEVDGTPGTNDMPGRLVFSTTADGASSPTEALRISSAQTISIGGSGTVSTAFYNRKNITGAVTAYANFTVAQAQSDVTSAAYGYRTSLSTAATAFTLGELTHYRSSQSTIGAGSTVTNQFGFLAGSDLTGATNNYGFYGNIASGANRYNFYAAGTADNYFAGSVGIGTTTMSQVFNVTAANASGFVGQRIQNNNSGSGLAGVEFSSDSTYAKAAIAQVRTNPNGAGPLVFYVDSNIDAANWVSGDEKMRIAVNGTISLGGTSGSQSLNVTPVTSSVNYWDFYGSPTGSDPYVFPSGSDTNRGFIYLTKGTGTHQFMTGSGLSNTQFLVAHTASAVNYLQVTGGTTGLYPNLSAQGSDANITMQYTAKGTGAMLFATGGGYQVAIAHTASTVNYLSLTGSATGNATSISAAGSDTNIDLALTPQGTGVLKYGTYTAGIIAQAGYITIKDAGGTTRRLLVG